LSVVHALPSSHEVGQLPSQISLLSTLPSPQCSGGGGQSLSLLCVQAGAQHPSPVSQIVIGALVHLIVQVAALPVAVSVVHQLLSLHKVGQSPSQVSPGSTMLLPHLGPDVPAAPPDVPAIMAADPPWGLAPLPAVPAAAIPPDAPLPAVNIPALPAVGAPFPFPLLAALATLDPPEPEVDSDVPSLVLETDTGPAASRVPASAALLA
jgi:hypothetical protein